MSATTLFFNGRLTSVPGAYSRVDASGLETVGLGASGIVAVLGTAEGGIPASEITEFADIPRFNKPEKMAAAFRSGQLREVGDMLFAPAKDEDILAGAQEILALKTNPSTQATGSLVSGATAQIDLTSVDYGAFTDQINVELQSGTDQGKMITIVFEDIVETKDDLGGDTLATLMYSGGGTGYTTAVASVNDAGDITVTATRTSLGKSTDIANASTNAAVEVLSASAGDTTQTVTVYGLVAGVATKETLSLNGTSVVPGATVWDAGSVAGVVLSAATAGNVTVRTLGGAGVNIFVVTAATLSKGVVLLDYAHVDRTSLSFVLDGAGTQTIQIWGRNAAGGAIKEALALTGTAPVVTPGTSYALVDVLVIGNVAVARTLTMTARAARSLAATQSTLQAAADYFNAKQTVIAGPATRGFIFTLETGLTSFLTSNLDVKTSVNIKDAAQLSLKADLYAIVSWINSNSQLITAKVSSGATTVPDNTTVPLFLTGGTEGVALFSHYQAALNLLKRGRVNSIVDLSGDPAVAAALDAHCAYMGGIGKSERDGFVGLLNDDLDDVPTKASVKSQIVDINSRHIRAAAQAITRFNSKGLRTEFLPPFQAALYAGMQAGSPVGTSLTHKYANALAIRQDSSWNPTDDADEMIQAGLCFMENIDGKGRRVVRNVTTHLSTSNLAFVEGSVNNAVNFAVYNFRGELEAAVGKRGFSGTLSATKGRAIGILGLLVDNTVITGFRSLDLELAADIMEVSVEMAPVIPINFVPTTVHLTNPLQAA